MYHYTRDLKHSRYPNIKGMDIDTFRRQMAFFKSNYTVISMEELIEAVENNVSLPNNALLLTFDDGYIDNYTYALPILEENGIQGSFFIPAKTFSAHSLLDVNKVHFVLACAEISTLLNDVRERMDYYRGSEYAYPSNEELWEQYAVSTRLDCKEVIFVKRMLQTVLPEEVRNRIASELFRQYVGVSEEQMAYELYMTEDQIKTMKRHGMFIGIHGYDHYWLGKLSSEQMHTDIGKALDEMGEFIDRNRWVMNYPYGNYSDEVLEFIRSEGAVIGFTTEPRVADLTKDDPLLLPRLDCNDFLAESEKGA